MATIHGFSEEAAAKLHRMWQEWSNRVLEQVEGITRRNAGGEMVWLAEAKADIEPGESGTFTVQQGGDTLTDSGLEPTAHDAIGCGALQGEKFLLRRVNRCKHLLFFPAVPIIRKAKVNSTAITAGSYNSVGIRDQSNNDTGFDVDAYADWAEGGEDISANKEILIAYIVDRWQVIGAECE